LIAHTGAAESPQRLSTPGLGGRAPPGVASRGGPLLPPPLLLLLQLRQLRQQPDFRTDDVDSRKHGPRK